MFYFAGVHTIQLTLFSLLNGRLLLQAQLLVLVVLIAIFKRLDEQLVSLGCLLLVDVLHTRLRLFRLLLELVKQEDELGEGVIEQSEVHAERTLLVNFCVDVAAAR